jgi:predicted ArsR family transcriptional regulator
MARVSAKRNGRARLQQALAAASGGLLVSELVASTKLHENAVRRTLSTLVAEGSVVVERQPSRVRGRPRLRYRLVGAADAPFRQLVPMLLDLLDASGASAGSAFEIGRAHAETAPVRATGNTREAVIESLVRLGFAPVEQPSGKPGVAALALTRCPFSDAVTASVEGRMICQLHHGLLAGVASAGGGAIDEFVINDPRVAPCRVAFRVAGERAGVSV